MNFEILTLFPEMVESGLHTSIIGRAMEQGILSVKAHNIRDYTKDKHRKTDDYTYGGGAGMLMQAQPVYDCFLAVDKEIKKRGGRQARVIYVTPQGRLFNQSLAEELSREENLVFLCGHYEGVDERVLEEIVTDYVSIGDYVLTGGELPAMVMIDAVARLVDGVLNNEESAQTESFYNCLLEYPQYSRPEEWRGKRVPEVLLSGNHQKIENWRLEQSIKRTKERRPDLYEQYEKRKACEKRLLTDKLLHMDMLEALRRNDADILYMGDEGVLLKEKRNGVYMLTAADGENGERILSGLAQRLEKEAANGGKRELPCLFVSHQAYMNDLICEKFNMEPEVECTQFVYTRKEPLPMKKETDIRKLGTDALPIISAHYTLAEEEYVVDRLKSGAVYGIYEGDELAGFIGMHKEGSIGMLEVFEGYRGKGYAKAMEAFYINLHLKQGFTPYGQVISGNAASMGLQKSLCLYPAKEKLYWLKKSLQFKE